MRITCEVKGLEEIQRGMKEFSERRMKAAVATALTRTSVQVRERVKSAMVSMLDKPTPYTVRQLKYVGASASKLVSVVGFNVEAVLDQRGNVIRYSDYTHDKTPAGRYLQPQMLGGKRSAKRFENALRMVGVLPAGWYAVPGERAKVDVYGNQSVGEIRQILSYFDAAELVAGSRQNMGTKGRAKMMKGTRKRAGAEYFVSPVGGSRTFVRAGGSKGSHSMQPGIYRRTHHALGTRVEPVVIFVRSVSYRRRFDFYNIANTEAARMLPVEIDKAIAESMARMLGNKV